MRKLAKRSTKSAYKPGKMCSSCPMIYQSRELIGGMCPACRHKRDVARAQFSFEAVEK